MPFTTMSNDDNDESEYAMCKHHVNCPTTLKPLKPNMLHFWHKEQARKGTRQDNIAQHMGNLVNSKWIVKQSCTNWQGGKRKGDIAKRQKNNPNKMPMMQ